MGCTTPPKWPGPPGKPSAGAHGGKDGTPIPVDRTEYDRTIDVMKKAIGSTKVGNPAGLEAIRRLARFYDIRSARLATTVSASSGGGPHPAGRSGSPRARAWRPPPHAAPRPWGPPPNRDTGLRWHIR